MASSANVFCGIIKNGLAERRKQDHAKLTQLLENGVQRDEAYRQVYFPWKTLTQYQAMCAEYEKMFGAKN